VFSRRNLSYPFRHSSSNPRRLNILQPLDSLFSAPVLRFQHLAASFSKTWGVTSFKPRNSRSLPLFQISPLATNHSPLSLLESALTDSRAHKPFRIRSYKKHGGRGTSFKPKSFRPFPLAAPDAPMAFLATRHYLFQNQHLQKNIKTNDFNFPIITLLQKTWGRGVTS